MPVKDALTIKQLASFNDSQKRKFKCMIFGHRWAKPYQARVKGNKGTHICELKSCDRCKRFKIGKIIKKNLNRAARRR